MEIGNQNLNNNGWIHLTDGLDHARKMISAAVLEIVSGHRRDDHMFELHPAHRFSYAGGFIFLEGKRFRGSNCTETASPGASVAGNHHGRCTLAPALPSIGALSALANRV